VSHEGNVFCVLSPFLTWGKEAENSPDSRMGGLARCSYCPKRKIENGVTTLRKKNRNYVLSPKFLGKEYSKNVFFKG